MNARFVMSVTRIVIAALLVGLLLAACGEEGDEWSEAEEAEYLAELYGANGAGLTEGKSVGKADAALAVPRGVLALTFDDGPHASRTPAVMDILERHGIAGVFFQLGSKIEDEPEVAAEVTTRGHHAANHCYVHKFMPDQGDDKLHNWISRTKELIGEAANGHYYFRPPYGGINARVRGVIESYDYKIMMWNIDTLDWDFADGETRFAWVPSLFRHDYIGWVMYHSRSVGGGVALFHDVHQFSVDNLETIITYWKDPAAYWASLDEATRNSYRAYYAQTGADPDLAFEFADINSYHWPSFMYDDGVQPDPGEWVAANEGWIGGECAEASNCNYAGASCFFPADADLGNPVGFCSQSCDKYCPDPTGSSMQYQTFCVELVEGEGSCAPKCSPAIPCPLNFECWLTSRFNDPLTQAYTCMPPTGNE